MSPSSNASSPSLDQNATCTNPLPSGDNGEVGYRPVRQKSSSTTGESGCKMTSIVAAASSARARAFASLFSLKPDKLAMWR